MSNILAGQRYTQDHEWVRLEGEQAYVGITDHAQHELGEIVFVELPPIGEHFAQGEEISTVESVKAASAILNPIDGVVAQANEDLDGSPELVNEDSYANHLYVLEAFSMKEYEGLMTSEQYEAYLNTL